MEINLNIAISNLKKGKIILYPTDTIWGIGCDATNEEAIKKIYKIKNRDINKPFIVLVSDIEMLKKYVENLHPRIETLLYYHNRPLTIIYKKAKNLPDILTGDKGSIAIRVIKEKVISKLIEKFGKPIVSSSANIAGEPFPRSYEEINQKIKKEVDYILPYKQNIPSDTTPSVIAKYNRNGKLKFLR